MTRVGSFCGDPGPYRGDPGPFRVVARFADGGVIASGSSGDALPAVIGRCEPTFCGDPGYRAAPPSFGRRPALTAARLTAWFLLTVLLSSAVGFVLLFGLALAQWAAQR